MSSSNGNNKYSPLSTQPISIEKLFDFKRFESLSDLLLIILYSPVGLCLFIIRFFIFIYVLMVSAILPHNSPLRRSLFFILGIWVNVDEEYLKNLKAKFLISNHVSDLDPIVLNLIMPCAYASSSVSPCYVSWLCHMLKENNETAYELTMKNIPIVCFPEQSKSNGKYGLFKFSFGLYHHVSLVHLIFLEVKRPFFKVSVSPLGAHWLADLFWLLFLPVTIFKIRHIGSVSKQENETYEEFTKRTQKEMASKTNLKTTDFSVHDKIEFLKRLNAETNLKNSLLKNSSKIKSSQKDSDIDKFSRKVKEILPQVPLYVIRKDIAITNNIDNTIERILSGIVKYQPESSKTSSIDCDSVSSSSNTEVKNEIDNKNYGSKSFGRTASERVASFQERKAQMFRMARIRYIQKHGPSNIY